MLIAERILKKWRREALRDITDPKFLAAYNGVDTEFFIDEIKELSQRILRMTQELLDQYLLQKK